MKQSSNALQSVIVGAVFFIASLCSVFAAVPSFVNFQGYLTSPSGTPLDTTVSVGFRLYDQSWSATPTWEEIHNVTVVNGHYDAQLGIANPLPQAFFDDASVWLGIQVGDDSEMTPRVQFSAVPYAYRIGTIDEAAGGSVNGDVTITGKLSAGHYNSNDGFEAFVQGAYGIAAGNYATVGGGKYNRARGSYSVVAGGGGDQPADSNSATGDFSTISGGTSNLATGAAATIAGGYEQIASGGSAAIGGGNYNQATADGATIAGGTFHQASGMWSTIAGGQNNRARGSRSFVGGGGGVIADSNSAVGANSVIGGGRRNYANGGESTIAGGFLNTATGQFAAIGGGFGNYVNTGSDFSTISGGRVNMIYGNYCTIGGGDSNIVITTADSGVANANYSTIAGGRFNKITCDYSGVLGGFGNTIEGGTSNVICGGTGNMMTDSIPSRHGVIGGGFYNYVGDSCATVPGGFNNVAVGACSFASGGLAYATHGGAFVWSDGTNMTHSDAANQFVVGASGGVKFYTNSARSAGVRLAAGGTSWIVISDSTKKTNRTPVDGNDVLKKLSAMPIDQWNYKHQPDGPKHIGPMAQDFWNAFQLGSDSLGIETLDADGIALAAIQELQKQNMELQTRTSLLETRLTRLEKQLEQFTNRTESTVGLSEK